MFCYTASFLRLPRSSFTFSTHDFNRVLLSLGCVQHRINLFPKTYHDNMTYLFDIMCKHTFTNAKSPYLVAFVASHIYIYTYTHYITPLTPDRDRPVVGEEGTQRAHLSTNTNHQPMAEATSSSSSSSTRKKLLGAFVTLAVAGLAIGLIGAFKSDAHRSNKAGDLKTSDYPTIIADGTEVSVCVRACVCVCVCVLSRGKDFLSLPVVLSFSPLLVDGWMDGWMSNVGRQINFLSLQHSHKHILYSRIHRLPRTKVEMQHPS